MHNMNSDGPFTEVEAAGGLVSDGRGKLLFIRRRGVWDLPKGHREQGEDITETAVREVMEETGLSDLELGALICVTDHSYERDGIRYLKHTWWYRMTYRGDAVPVPQTEEDISEVVWLDSARTAEALSDTYPSIVEVVETAGK